MTVKQCAKVPDGQVIHLYQRAPQEALERLNRITGLRFARWPESLVPAPQTPEMTSPAPADECLSPVGIASA